MVYNRLMDKKPEEEGKRKKSQSIRFEAEIAQKIVEWMETTHEKSFNTAVVQLVEMGLREVAWEGQQLEELRLSREIAAEDIYRQRQEERTEKKRIPKEKKGAARSKRKAGPSPLSDAASGSN